MTSDIPFDVILQIIGHLPMKKQFACSKLSRRFRQALTPKAWSTCVQRSITSSFSWIMYMILRFPEKPWDWAWLSRNPSVKMSDVLEHPEKPWNWAELSRNPGIKLSDVLEHPEKPWNWIYLSNNPGIKLSDVLEHPEKPWNWAGLSIKS